jgi:hypothetical protein
MKYSFAIALFALSLLAACNNTPALPTTAPTIAAPTQPAAAATVAVTAAPTATSAPVVRRTLPPEWTATVAVTEVPPPTEVVITSTPFVPQSDLPPACKTFDIIYDQSTHKFQLGTAPTVAWLPVEGAIRYNVQLSDANSRVIKSDIFIAETTYTFDPILFNQASNVYVWSVYPINQAGDQMCFGVGDQMYPSVVPV